MSSPNFIDYVKIYFRSGNGGQGSVHFRREKFVPKGGPDGGDGGRGGHIILRGNAQLWTLLHLKYRKHVIAGNGQPGAGAGKTGKDGEDIVLEVPLGTIARREDESLPLLEITHDGEEKILLPGGQGGKGNLFFKSATNQTPRFAQEGESGVEKPLILELKLLADVGLVGFPNAGKSTLLSSISAAKPEIADYPFTTLVPHLGVVPYRDYKSFVMADIPGIIEGAAEGKGLGTRFLRHIERNSILLFVIPVDSNNVTEDYHVLLKELENYNPELLDKDRLIAISKADMLDDELIAEFEKELKDLPEHIFISSVTGKNLIELKDKVWALINI